MFTLEQQKQIAINDFRRNIPDDQKALLELMEVAFLAGLNKGIEIGEQHGKDYVFGLMED